MKERRGGERSTQIKHYENDIMKPNRNETSKQTNKQNRSLSYLLKIKILWSYFMITGLESQW